MSIDKMVSVEWISEMFFKFNFRTLVFKYTHKYDDHITCKFKVSTFLWYQALYFFNKTSAGDSTFYRLPPFTEKSLSEGSQYDSHILT